MDHLSCHKVAPAVATVVYSPDLNPIEQAFAKAKGEVRKRKPRVVTDIERLCGDALDWFPSDGGRNYIRHAGYGPQRTD